MASAAPGAHQGASIGQKAAIVTTALIVAIIAVMAPAPAALLAIVASPVFLAFMMLQLAAVVDSAPPARAVEPPLNAARHWPIYSVLVPLYRESAILDQLLTALSALDYPATSLDAVLLLEADDAETHDALRARTLPDWLRVEVVPAGQPRTKPRALNHGLTLIHGQFVTVYDAEDIPDPDQLKRAVIAFEEAASDVGCLQARLAIDNGPDGWLPLMMAVEYAALFDVVKCPERISGVSGRNL
jgi:glycosyltransferase XagB